MADPLSIVGTAIAIVQLTGGCITLLKSHVGPSKYGTADFQSMEMNLNDFMQAMKEFKTHIETHCVTYTQREEPFNSLDQLKRAMEDCRTALGFIESFLSKDRLQRTFLGAKFDRRLGKALLSLKKARQLFMEVIALNNNASFLRVEQGILGLKGEIQGLHDLVANYQILAPERHYRTY
ncbi:hypothetical protein F5B19DRAFT_465601 [Rostrohypoxylon terebratum]|nr:hypothetical protein F5B19DRAFT_465601 [Rostrohypoxylon terebratum]